jgi:hypothetical protein
MSSYINDENNDSCNDSVSSQMDSGYLTFNSPSRLSPSIVIYNQLDSPISEDDIQSPINPSIQKFLSTIDYENYRTTRKYFDILTQLFHRNAYHLIDKILKNLTNNDFIYCLIVCKKWYFILKDYHQRKQTKNVKRNLFNNNNDNTKTLTSTPMKIITNKISLKSIIPFNNIKIEENRLSSQSISTEDNIHLTASTMTFRYGYLKYLHGPTIPKRCPLCAFVSIVDVNDQHG